MAPRLSCYHCFKLVGGARAAFRPPRDDVAAEEAINGITLRDKAFCCEACFDATRLALSSLQAGAGSAAATQAGAPSKSVQAFSASSLSHLAGSSFDAAVLSDLQSRRSDLATQLAAMEDAAAEERMRELVGDADVMPLPVVSGTSDPRAARGAGGSASAFGAPVPASPIGVGGKADDGDGDDGDAVAGFVGRRDGGGDRDGVGDDVFGAIAAAASRAARVLVPSGDASDALNG